MKGISMSQFFILQLLMCVRAALAAWYHHRPFMAAAADNNNNRRKRQQQQQPDIKSMAFFLTTCLGRVGRHNNYTSMWASAIKI
jgi:hypothetical protein